MPYNGWTNYETWNVKLWIDNEEGSYHYWRDATKQSLEDSTKEDAIRNLADSLKQEHQDNAPELTGTYADLLGAALSEVDWYEIAESMVNDWLEEHPEDTEEGE